MIVTHLIKEDRAFIFLKTAFALIKFENLSCFLIFDLSLHAFEFAFNSSFCLPLFWRIHADFDLKRTCRLLMLKNEFSSGILLENEYAALKQNRLLIFGLRKVNFRFEEMIQVLISIWFMEIWITDFVSDWRKWFPGFDLHSLFLRRVCLDFGFELKFSLFRKEIRKGKRKCKMIVYINWNYLKIKIKLNDTCH